MRIITDHLLTAIAIVAVVVLLFFFKLAAGYAVDPSFVSATVISSTVPGASANKSQALAGWIGNHSWGWGRGRPRLGFGPDEIVLEIQYPNGSHAKMTVQKETICKTDQDGMVWRLLSPQEHSELTAILAE